MPHKNTQKKKAECRFCNADLWHDYSCRQVCMGAKRQLHLVVAFWMSTPMFYWQHWSKPIFTASRFEQKNHFFQTLQELDVPFLYAFLTHLFVKKWSSIQFSKFLKICNFNQFRSKKALNGNFREFSIFERSIFGCYSAMKCFELIQLARYVFKVFYHSMDSMHAWWSRIFRFFIVKQRKSQSLKMIFQRLQLWYTIRL